MDARLSDPKHPRGETGSDPVGADRVVVLDDIAWRAPYPFSSQNDHQLLLLDFEPEGWVFAELHFDRVACRYGEVRRATYAWSREAVGALLSRALSVSDTALIDTVERLDDYMRHHYDVALIDA